MKDFLSQLNEQQRAAVEYINGPMIIFAGAGTGKTRVITYRIAYLLSIGVNPYNILAVTFTNKAAEEMKKRISQLVPDKAEDVWISTFHSFCANFLYKEADKVGLNKNFVIYDESDSIKVIKECLKELSLVDAKIPVYTIYEEISRAKDNLIDPESYEINSFLFRQSYREKIAEVYKRYQQKLTQYNAVDFGDLLMKTIEILRDEKFSDIKTKYCERFKYIHVDEFQDVNYAQVVLLKLLTSKHKNICVVGDDDQAIYSWRGGDVRYLLNFKKDFSTKEHPVKEFVLEKNYRSRQSILTLANTLLKNNKHRVKKNLYSEISGNIQTDINLLQCDDEYDEARFVAKEIIELDKNVNKKISVAVLYRTNAQSRVFEEVFREYNIPYSIRGTVGFYERKEIKDIIAYLRILVNPKDDLSLKRILNVPPRGISDTTILYIETLAKENNISFWEQLTEIDKTDLSLKAKNAVWKFLTLYDLLKRYSETLYPSEFIKFLVEKIGYYEMIDETDKYENKLERKQNIGELVNIAKKLEAEENMTSVSELLSKLSLTTAADIEFSTNLLKTSEFNINVLLATLHAVKGLEFDVVFITGLEEGLLPIFWVTDKKSFYTNFQDEKVFRDSSDVEEERRLLYVGITRAKQKVYLSYSFTRYFFGIKKESLPSRFIEEILDVFKTETTKGGIKDNSFNLQKIQKIENLRIGEYVVHKKFGIGKVIDILREPENDKIVVLFQDGQSRKLSLKYANLIKLERLDNEKNY